MKSCSWPLMTLSLAATLDLEQSRRVGFGFPPLLTQVDHKEQEEAEKEGREVKKKPKKSKKKQTKSEQHTGHQTAIEAIEKIVAEKKISTKINYDVLRSLSSSASGPSTPLGKN